MKAALKLLLVFFEYTDTNCLQLLRAMYRVQQTHGLKPWASVMKILSQRDNADMELLIFAMSLINKVNRKPLPCDSSKLPNFHLKVNSLLVHFDKYNAIFCKIIFSIYNYTYCETVVVTFRRARISRSFVNDPFVVRNLYKCFKHWRESAVF